MEKLKVCPFCGGDAYPPPEWLATAQGTPIVGCSRCRIDMAMHDWQRRVAAEDADGWISMDDALPIDDRDVLVWDDDSETYINFLTGYGEGRRWWAGDFRVTHWQPLPGPPVSRSGGGPAASAGGPSHA